MTSPEAAVARTSLIIGYGHSVHERAVHELAAGTRFDHPGVHKIWADQGFAARLVDRTAEILGRELVVVRKDPGQLGFQVQPKRRAIEHTFTSWINDHRRLARDYEISPAHAEP